jgi:hypothetical protein
MKTRGRDSAAAAALTVITADGVETNRRPKPPDELNEQQAAEWNSIVNRLPAEWFPRETHAMLAQYCCHVIGARRIEQLIANEEMSAGIDLDSYDKLLKMRERESRIISSLATRMRISQQSTYDKSRKKPLTPRKPWENQNTKNE